MPNVADFLADLSEKAKRIQITKMNSNPVTYQAHPKSPNEKYTLTLHRCSCNELTFSGFPCQHLIALHKQEKNSFPIVLVKLRWFKNKDVSKDPLPLNSLLLASNEEENNEIVIDLSNQPDPDTERIMRQSAGQVFNKLNDLTKTYVQAIMKQPPQQISEEMETIENRISTLRSLPPAIEAMPTLQDPPIQSPTIPAVDHVDVHGNLPGRPPKARKTREYTKPPKPCLICTEIHPMSKCPFYQLYTLFLDRNPSPQSKGRMCSLCKRPNHVVSDCLLRKFSQMHTKPNL